MEIPPPRSVEIRLGNCELSGNRLVVLARTFNVIGKAEIA